MAGETSIGAEIRGPEPELVFELSQAALLGIKEKFGMPGGKFVRVGPDLILVAPLFYSSHGGHVNVYHRQILNRVAQEGNEELQSRLKLAQTEELSGASVVDAGTFLFTDEAGAILDLQLQGYSTSYGPVSSEVRTETGRIAEQHLGEQVQITVGP